MLTSENKEISIERLNTGCFKPQNLQKLKSSTKLNIKITDAKSTPLLI